MLNKSGDYKKILIDNGKIGWVKNEDIIKGLKRFYTQLSFYLSFYSNYFDADF